MVAMKNKVFIVFIIIILFVLGYLVNSYSYLTLEKIDKGKKRKIELTGKQVNDFYTSKFSRNYLILRQYPKRFYFFKHKSDTLYTFIDSLILDKGASSFSYYDHYFTYSLGDSILKIYDIETRKIFGFNLTGLFNSREEYIILQQDCFFDSLLVYIKGRHQDFYHLTLNIFNIKQHKIIKSFSFTIDSNISNNLLRIYTNYYKGKLYFSTRFSPYLYRYDFQSQSLDSTQAVSLIIDSIPVHTFKEFFSPRYVFITFDTVNGYILRYYWGDDPVRLFGAVVIDMKRFKQVGEYFPDENPLLAIMSKKYGVFEDDNKFYLVRYAYRPRIKFLWRNRVKKKLYSNQNHDDRCLVAAEKLEAGTLKYYLKKINVYKDSTIFVILPKDFSCPSCIDYTSLVLQANYSLLRNRVKVIWSGESNEFKDEHLAFVKDTSFVYVDTQRVFYDFFHLTAYNPIILKTGQDTVVFYHLYLPNELEQITIDLSRLLKK